MTAQYTTPKTKIFIRDPFFGKLRSMLTRKSEWKPVVRCFAGQIRPALASIRPHVRVSKSL